MIMSNLGPGEPLVPAPNSLFYSGSGGDSNFVLAPKGDTCEKAGFTSIKSGDECAEGRKAMMQANKDWTDSGRGLQQGTWAGLPAWCTIQLPNSSPGYTAHFKTIDTNDNTARKAEFQSLCVHKSNWYLLYY